MPKGEKHEENGLTSAHVNDETCEPLTNAKPVQNTEEVENEPSKTNNCQKLTLEVLIASVIITAAISAGMATGHSAVLLPQLESLNGTLHTDEEMGSWIVSIGVIANPIGSLLSGIMMDSLGRKLTMQIRTAVSIAGWVIVTACQTHAVLLVGRFILGFGIGLGMAANQIYIAEVLEPNMRTIFSTLLMVSNSFGVLLIYVLGSTVDWRLASGLSTIPTATSVFVYFFLPESPVWLVRHGHIDKAEKATLRLRGNNVIQANQEIRQIIIRAEIEKIQKEQSQSAWTTFCTPQVVKPFIITVIFILLQSFSGVVIIILYAVDVIAYMGRNDINKFFVAVLTAGVRFVFSLVAIFLLASLKRRTIGIASALGTGIFALCLAMFLHSDCRNNSYFVTICLLCYVGANTAGLAVLPTIMIGEIFPARARGLAGSLAFTTFSVTTFSVAKLFPVLKKLLGVHGFFLVFGISAFLCSLFIYCAVPETKGKTLNEIEDYFSQDNVLWITRNKKNDQANSVKTVSST